MEIIVDLGPEKRAVYSFMIQSLSAVFVGFELQQKPKGKRKWQTLDHWDRYFSRNSTIPEPEIPQSVRDQAKDQMITMIKVLRFEEWKR